MAPGSSSNNAGGSGSSSSNVLVQLAEPVIFLRNYDPATDRRERRTQRRRQQAESNGIPVESPRAPAPSSSAFVPPSGGRGGAGSASPGPRNSSRTRAAVLSSSTSGGRNPSSRSPSRDRERGRSREASRARSRNGSRAASPVVAGRTGANGPAGGGLGSAEAANGEGLETPDPHDSDHNDIDLVRPPAVIRGVLTVHLSKPTRIKKIGVRLKGQSKTEWPEGIGTRKLETVERNLLIDNQVIFFDANADSRAERRAASIGPADVGPNGLSTRPRSRSRNMAVRATSLMPMQEYGSSSNTRNASPLPGPSAARIDYSPSRSPSAARTGVRRMSITEPNALLNAPTSPEEDAPPYQDERASSANGRGSAATGRHDRLSELRTIAGSPATTPESSATPSRASSVRDHPYDSPNSRSASLHSSTDAHETTAPTVNGAPMTSPNTMLQRNLSRASLGSVPDEGADADEPRGRSSQPARGARGLLSASGDNQLAEEEDQLRSLPGSGSTTRTPSLRAPRTDGSSTSPHLRDRSLTPMSALRASTSSTQNTGSATANVRSASVVSNAKSARFSLGGLLGKGRSVSRQRTDSPDGFRGTGAADEMGSLRGRRGRDTERASSTSNGRIPSSSRGRSTSAFRALKDSLTGHMGGHNATGNGNMSLQSRQDSDSDDDSSDDEGRGRARNVGWQEFKAGTYNYAIFMHLPASLPPTIHATHGGVTYMLKGFCNRAGALTSNLNTTTEVHVVSAPHEDDLEAIDSIIVERMWETQLSYKITIHCKSVPIGGTIPISIRLNPLTKLKVYRLTATMEEKHTYYAKDKTVARSPGIRKYEICRIQNDDGEPLLPILSDSPDALATSKLKDWIVDSSSSDNLGITTLDPLGPWHLDSELQVPDCSSSLHFSTTHDKAQMTVVHSLKVCLRVDRGDDEQLDPKGNRKKFDIIIEAPMHILSCRTSQVNTLPTYTTSASRDAMSASRPDNAFHPHELSDVERLSSFNRNQNVTPMLSVAATQTGLAQSHRTHSGLSNELCLPEMNGSTQEESPATPRQPWTAQAASNEPPPPTYEYARAHPEEEAEPPRAGPSSIAA